VYQSGHLAPMDIARCTWVMSNPQPQVDNTYLPIPDVVDDLKPAWVEPPRNSTYVHR
jgi:hypothetical protein